MGMILRAMLSAVMIACLAAGQSAAAGRDSLRLGLEDVVSMARLRSPSAQSARNAFFSAYWDYRSFRANYLPSVTVSASPYINKEMNKITQSDGSATFLRQAQWGADMTLKINQNVGLTGGSFFISRLFLWGTDIAGGFDRLLPASAAVVPSSEQGALAAAGERSLPH